MTRRVVLFLILLVLALTTAVACSAVAPTPTPFPTPADTAVAEATVTDVARDVVTEAPTAAPTTAPQPSATSAAVATDPEIAAAPATPTPRQTSTPTTVPTETPTSLPQLRPTLAVSEPQPVGEGIATPATAIPTAVATFEVPSSTTNVLLLGSDSPVGDAGVKRTDTMIIVSINREGPTASMVSLPRDLYVYIPGGTMNRLNTAVTVGGPNLLKQTILYNFGIPIHYYARVDFDGFQDIVDAIGGIEVAVSCEFRDWRLKSPELDIEDEDSWEVQTLTPGVYTMDGDTALWYARSRLLSNDFDRGRRQQQILRAMLNQGVDLNLVPRVPELYNTFRDTVDTDMDIGRILQIASLAPAIRENGVQNLYVYGKTTTWVVPDNSAQVLLPNWEGPGMMRDTFQRLFLPPALNKATRAPILVEVVNASGNPDMARLAAENLAWYGFAPVISDEEVAVRPDTQVMYYAPNFKGSFDWLMSFVLSVDQEQILLNDVDPSEYSYRVIVGEDYDPCVNEFFAPQGFVQ